MRRTTISFFAMGLAAGVIGYSRAEDTFHRPTTAPAIAYTPADGLDYWRGINFPTVRFSGTSLEDALNQFRDATHANLVIDWDGIERWGMSRTTPIRLRLYNVSAFKALELILADAKGPNNEFKLEFWADEEGVIHVTDLPEQNMPVRMYDVRDLIARLFEPEAKESDAVDRDFKAVANRANMLVALMTTTVDPGGWRDTGGGIAEVHVFAGHLLVTQTRLNHRKIEWLLYNLRKITEARARGEKPTTRGIDLLAPPTTEAGKH